MESETLFQGCQKSNKEKKCAVFLQLAHSNSKKKINIWLSFIKLVFNKFSVKKTNNV